MRGVDRLWWMFEIHTSHGMHSDWYTAAQPEQSISAFLIGLMFVSTTCDP